MPPSDTNEGLPGLRPASSRKRKETTRFLENGDPPQPKKKRVSVSGKPAPKGAEPPTHSSPPTQSSTVDLEDGRNDESDTSEHLPKKNPKSVDRADDDTRTLSDVDDDDEVEEVEESAESERSKPITGKNHHH
jgi:hypothetical protein